MGTVIGIGIGIQKKVQLGTGLKQPAALTLTLINGGVRLDWTDTSGGTAQTEIWGKSNSGSYTLITTINAGVVTYNDIITPVDARYYKIRSKLGTIISEYTVEQVAIMLGSDIICMGNFDVPTYYTYTNGWTISGGTANFSRTPVANASDLVHLKSIVAGKKYAISFTISNYNANTMWAIKSNYDQWLFDGALGTYINRTNGNHSFIQTAQRSCDGLLLRGYGGLNPGQPFSLDNLSIREVNPQTFDNAKLVLTFDGNENAGISTAFAYLKQRNVKGTLYAVTTIPSAFGTLTWDAIIAIHNDGHDVQCHTNTHVDFRTLSQAQITAEFQAVNDAFVAHNLPVPVHTALPYGYWNQTVIDGVVNSGLRLSNRMFDSHDGGQINTYKDSYKFKLKDVWTDANNTSFNVPQFKERMLDAYLHKSAIITTNHGVGTAALGNILPADLGLIIDYAQELGMDIITISELYNSMNV